jgi:transcriptional regulator GlxA family with amidase domain
VILDMCQVPYGRKVAISDGLAKTNAAVQSIRDRATREIRERAVHLLQTSTASVDQIAAQVGYADGVTLRTLIRRKIGRGVRELRAHN